MPGSLGIALVAVALFAFTALALFSLAPGAAATLAATARIIATRLAARDRLAVDVK